MFHKKKKPTTNPEVHEAMKERDDLLDKLKGTVEKVDRLRDEYEEAEKLRGKPWS